jgi:predicted O-methyltransferase YrrM
MDIDPDDAALAHPRFPLPETGAGPLLDEDPAASAARLRAAESGVEAVTPEVGGVLCLLAAAVGARTVAETGTGSGVSGLWLLRGMAPDGVLTTMDADPEHQRQARGAFADAGYPSGRVRLIVGSALDVLPRLAEGAYDLVHLDADPASYDTQLTEALRLLRPGGLVAVSAPPALRLPGTGERDRAARSWEAVTARLRDAPDLVPARVDPALVAAVKRA